MVQQLMEDFIVIDATAGYTVAEAVDIFRRNVICAETGDYKLFGGAHTIKGINTRETVFEVWMPRSVLQSERFQVADRLWIDQSKAEKQQSVLVSKISAAEMQLKKKR